MKPGRQGPRPTARERGEGWTWLAGRNSVIEALRAGRRLRRVLVAESAHGEAVDTLIRIARERGLLLHRVPRDQLDGLVEDTHHQGVLAEAAPFGYRGVDDLLAVARGHAQPPLLLALDGVQDPQNLGTLLRTALATGTHGVLLPEHRAASVTPAVSRASAGAVEHLAVARVTNLGRTLAALKSQDVWIHGLAVDGDLPFWEVDWAAPSALVVGAEGAGLGRLVRERCDTVVRIPMAAQALQSLNAATAGSLVLYEAYRQRQRPGAAP